MTRSTFFLSLGLWIWAGSALALPEPWLGDWWGEMGSGNHRFQVAFQLKEDSGYYNNLDDGIYNEPLTFDARDGELKAKTRGGGLLKLDYFPACPVLTGTFTQGPGVDGKESLVGVGTSYPVTLRRGGERLRPRERNDYVYAPPTQGTDGLAVGELQGPRVGAMQNLVREIGKGKFKHIHSLLLVKDGRLVLEEYFYGYGPGDAHPVQSVTKSLFSLLLGTAIEKGWISLSAKLYDFFPDLRGQKDWDPRKDRITLRDILTMSSGVACDDWEKGEGCSWAMVDSPDWNRFALGLPVVFEPGSHFAYCGACLSPLVEILERKSGVPLSTFADQTLFKPLGIESPAWWEGPNGSHSPAFGLSLRPRDMAKIGQMVLQKGKWNGRQVVPKNWIEESTSPQVAGLPGKRPDYGYLWWSRNALAGAKKYRVVMAWGVGGQYIYIVPEAGLVMVLTGGDEKDALSSTRCKELFQRTLSILATTPKVKSRGDLHRQDAKAAKKD
jgi:CubicO group peptidase (beta-lactamase class C family)